MLGLLFPARSTISMLTLSTPFTPAYLGRYHGLGLQRANRSPLSTLGAVGVVGLLGGGYVGGLGAQAQPARTAAAWRDFDPGDDAVRLPRRHTTKRLAHPVHSADGRGVDAVLCLLRDGLPDRAGRSGARLRGTAMAIYFFAMYVLGGAFGTTALGILSDQMSRRAMAAAGAVQMTEAFRAEGLHSAFLIVPVVALLLALVLFAGSRTGGGRHRKAAALGA